MKKLHGYWSLTSHEDRNDSSSGMKMFPVWKWRLIPFSDERESSSSRVDSYSSPRLPSKEQNVSSNTNPVPTVESFSELPLFPRRKNEGTPREYGTRKSIKRHR